MARINPLNPTGALDHTASATPDMFFTKDQLAQLLGRFGGGTGPAGSVGGGGGGGAGGIPQSVVDSIQSRINEANAANEQRYQQGLGVIDSGKTDVVSMLKDLFGQILGAGTDTTPALAREAKRTKDVVGSATGALTARGLGNTNLLADIQRGAADDSATRQEEIYNQANQTSNAYRAQLATMLMSALQQHTQEKSGFIERRSDLPPDLGELANIWGRPGATGNVALSGQPLIRRGGAAPQLGGYSTPAMTGGGMNPSTQLALPQITLRPRPRQRLGNFPSSAVDYKTTPLNPVRPQYA